ncbi:MAG: hypothetical protein AB8B91_08300, partial [Rubripirellula sp.]
MECLEQRRLLARDVTIGIVDTPASYTRGVFGTDVVYTLNTDSAQIGDFAINNDLIGGNNVTVNTSGSGSQAGDILIESAFFSGGGTNSLSLIADGSVGLTSTNLLNMNVDVQSPTAFSMDGNTTIDVVDFSLTTDSFAAVDGGSGPQISGTGNLTLLPSTPSTSIGLGGGAGALSLDGTELGLIDGFANVVIGDSAAGTGTVTIENANFTSAVSIHGGSIQVNDNLSGDAAITLSTNDAVGTGQDINVTNGTISSLTQSILLDAADNLTIASAAAVDALAGAVTIRLDSPNADVGLGSIATIDGSVTATTTRTITGGGDSDTIALGGTAVGFTATGPASGTATSGTNSFSFVNVEAVSTSGPVNTANLTFAGDETLTVSSPAAGTIQIASSLGPVLSAQSTLGLTVNTGTGSDTINFLSTSVGVTDAIFIDGDAVGNTVNINEPLANTSGGIEITADVINVNSTVTATNGVVLDAATSVALNNDVSADGGVQFNGAVAVAVDVAVSSAGGLIDFSNAVDGAGILTVVGSTGVNFGGVIGGVTSLGGLNATSTGDIFLNGDASTTGDQVYSGAVQVVGGPALSISSQGAITFNSTLNDAASDLTDLTINAAGVATFSGDVGTTRLRSLAVTSGGPMSNSVSFAALNDVSFAVTDSAGSTDNLTISGTVSSAAGNVTLTAGDDLEIQNTATINAGSNINLNIDPIVGDADAEGGTATIANVFGGVASVTGGNDTDRFIPEPGVLANFDGGDPAGAPGDTLVFDAVNSGAGFTSDSVTSESQTLGLTNIERVEVSNADAIGIDGGIADDVFTLAAEPGLSVVGWNLGPSVAYDPGLVLTSTINGNDGDDTLIVDLSGGVPTGTLDFFGGPNSGGAPADQILIQGTPPSLVTDIVFDYLNSNDGAIGIDGATINYTGLEPITSSVDSTNVTLNFSGVAETIDVSQVGTNITVDSTAGEITTFVAPSGNLIIATGGGADTVNVDGLNVTLTGEFFIDDLAPEDDTVVFSGAASTILTGGLNVPVPQVQVSANLSVEGDVRLGAATGTGLVQATGAITSAGAIVFDEPLMLNGATTVTADSQVSFHFAIDGNQDLSVTGGTGVDFLAENGTTTPLSNLTVTATTGTIRLDDFSTTGNQTYNSPVVTGAGGGTVDVISNAGAIAFASTIENGSVPADSLMTDSDSETTFGGSIGAANALDSLAVNASGDIVFANDVTVVNDITVDSADGGFDNFVLQSPAALTTGATGIITLNILDDVDIQAGSAITAANLNINVDDMVTADDIGTGSSVTVGGTLTIAGLTSIGGGVDADAFSITPQSGTQFFVDGSDPNAAPGDTLVLNGGGLDASIDTTGQITIVGSQPVSTTGIEDVSLANVNNLVVSGGIGNDQVTVADDPAVVGGSIVTINGNSIAVSSVTALVFNGGAGDDTLTLDATGGLPVVPVTINGQTQDGTNGGDQLTVLGSFTTQTLNYTAPNADGNAGTVDLDGTLVTYTGLEPINAGNSVDTILNFNTGMANNASLRDSVANAGQIEIVDNGATFEDTIIPNPTNSLAINLGDQGDTLLVTALDAAYAASLIIGGGVGTDNVQFNTVDISNTPGRGLDVSGVESLTVTNSTFSGNSAGIESGGGVRIDGGISTITGTTFSTNMALTGGGLAITSGTATIDASTFSANTATGDLATEGGGAIAIEGSVTIQNSTMITGNTASGLAGSGGGILVGVNGTLTASDTTISGNVANRAGGGIEHQSNSTLTLNTVTLSGNDAGVAPAVAAPGNGGGLHVTGNGSVDVSGGTINGNRAAAEGGGLWNDQGTLTISGGATIEANIAMGDLDPVGVNTDLQGGGGVFNNGGSLVINDIGGAVVIQNNQASGASRGSGGGVLSIGGSVDITGASIQTNEAVRAGGGIELIEGAVTITGGTIGGNDVSNADLLGSGLGASPGNGGGLHVTGAADVTVDGTLVQGNSAAAEGGGLWNGSGTMTVRNGAVIENNIASGDAFDEGGGGIFNNAGTLVVTGATTVIRNNQANGILGLGGGILNNFLDTNLSITDATITANTSVGGGGGLYSEATLTPATLSNVTFSLNVTGGRGGGAFISDHEVTISDSTFLSNQAQGGAGGGLNFEHSVITLSNSTFDSNTATEGGGGLFLTDANGQVNGGRFSMNQVSGGLANIENGGGGVLVSLAAGPLLFTGVQLDQNSAPAGGGLAVFDSNVTLQTGAVVSGNTASDALAGGGGVAFESTTGTHVVTVIDASLTGNTAAGFGGGIHVLSGDVLMTGTSMTGNQANGG